jgi:hypothetical protein
MVNDSFVTSRAHILQELLQCRNKGYTIGIWSSHLGTGMFLCSVKEVCTDEDEDDIMIILKEAEFTSPHINTHVVYLHEIVRLYTFRETQSETKIFTNIPQNTP